MNNIFSNVVMDLGGDDKQQFVQINIIIVV